MLETGTCLNNTYTIIDKIGSGGGGIVYKAWHENLRKFVAVKQTKGVAREALHNRTEADILKNLRNTYLPQVYDFLVIDGEVFTVIDYIEGESLNKTLKREGRIEQQEVLKWARQLAEALSYLHEQNPPIIHGDIKPANIMLTPSRDICLIDFNVSLVFDETRRKAAGISKGYSPPEQYRSYAIYCQLTGTSHTPETASAGRITEALAGRGIDERSDIYSFGASLYHLLTGIYPSPNYDELIPLGRCRISVSEGLSLVIGKMMALDPDDRYSNGTEVLNALQNIHKLDSVYIAYRRRTAVRRWIAAGLLTTGIILTAGGIHQLKQERQNNYNHMLEAAQSAIDSGEFETAAAYISEAMEMIPTRIDAYQKETLRLYESGEYETCIRYGRTAVNSPEYHIVSDIDRKLLGDIIYTVGNAYFEQSDYDNALNCFRSAIDYNADNAAYYTDYSVAAARAGNMREAENILEQAETLHLPQGTVYMLKGEFAYCDGRPAEAVELLEKALTLLEGSIERRRCILLCANAYEQLDKPYISREIEFLEQWKDAFSAAGNIQVMEKLAEAYVRNKEFGRAIETLEEIKTKGYTSYQVIENLSVLYQQTGDLASAKSELDGLITEYPERYEAYKRMAFLEADLQQQKPNRQRDYTQMKAYYDNAVSLYDAQKSPDAEMQQLDGMIAELKAGGWF